MSFKCQSNLYCTPSRLGERHCCNTGQKWDSGEKVCTGSEGCLSTAPRKSRLKDCVNAVKTTLLEKGRRNFPEGVSYLIQECVTSSGTVCCEVDLGGVKSTEFVNKGDCIKSY